MATKASVLLLSLFCLLISAVTPNYLPAVTTPIQLHRGLPRPSMPYPTKAPNFHELRRRQTTQRTLLGAPDNTCGYLGGTSSAPWGCSTGNCVFATASANSTNTVGSVLCCDPFMGCPAAPAPTACVDKGRYDYNRTCTGSCPEDPMTLKCTSGIDIYCNIITFSAPPISAYFCNYLSSYDAIPAETSYVGQTAHSFTPTMAHFATPTPPSSTSVSKPSSTISGAATATAKKGAGEKTTLREGVIIGVLGGIVALLFL